MHLPNVAAELVAAACWCAVMKLKSQLRFDLPGSRNAPAYGLIPIFDLLVPERTFALATEFESAGVAGTFFANGSTGLLAGPLPDEGVGLERNSNTATAATTTIPSADRMSRFINRVRMTLR